ncbi:MAG: porin [Ignavibacteria bacterium]|nr:porin [Ignavibacteria bacterium]
MTKISLLVTVLMHLSVCTPLLSADEDTKFIIGGYIDAYIATDNGISRTNMKDDTNMRQFTFVSPRKNEFAINTAQVTGKINYKGIVRSIMTFHVGDLHKTAYSATGVQMPIVQQANAGIKIFDNLWLDAGYFLTHIGGEGMLPKDNWLTSHSLVTYFEPFFQAGIRASYETDDLTGQFWVLNGNGIFDENNYNKTFGGFLSYRFADYITVSYAGVIGNEEPGNPNDAITHQLHNLVASLSITKEFAVKLQGDLALKDVKDANGKIINGQYLGVFATAHYEFIKKLSGTFRFAFVDNEDGVYAPALSGIDLTLGCEYKPYDNSYIRLEGRMLNFGDNYKLFNMNSGKPTNSRSDFILNFGVWIN